VKLIPPGNDARRNTQFIGKKDDLLLAATVINPGIMPDSRMTSNSLIASAPFEHILEFLSGSIYC
jgi:hypothetical protein